MTWETRTVSLLVNQPGESIFTEGATTVSIDDEAAGEFVVVEQDGDGAKGKIAIEPGQWPSLREAIDRMIAECRI